MIGGLPVYVGEFILEKMRASDYYDHFRDLLDAWCLEEFDHPYMRLERDFYRTGQAFLRHELTHEDWYVSLYMELHNVNGGLALELTAFDTPEWLR